MNEPGGFDLNDPERDAQGANEAHPRAVGAPLPIGASGKTYPAPHEDEMKRVGPVPPLGRALANPTSGPEDQQSSGMDRAMGVLRLALPFVQRILPILDGNFGTAVANVLAPRPHPQQAQPPVNLKPLETSLTELQGQHLDLRNQVMEQNVSLKRVEDQLEMVREATDRNTLEQQELMEDLKTVGSRINMFALLALLLLAASIALNVVLLLHIQRVLP